MKVVICRRDGRMNMRSECWNWVVDQGVEGSRPAVTLLGRSLFVFVSARRRDLAVRGARAHPG